MIAHFFQWIACSSLFFFLDIFFQGLFFQSFFHFTLILNIVSLEKEKSWHLQTILLALLYLTASLNSTSSTLYILLWIGLITITAYLKKVFLDNPFLPYILLLFCLLIKSVVLHLIFKLPAPDWLYTSGQCIGNLGVLLISLKCFSAVKAGNRL